MMAAGEPDNEQAIVLRRVEFGESDLIVSLLCSQSGRVDAFAAGARKSQRRFSGGIDGFALMEVQVKAGRPDALFRLQRSETIESWGNILRSRLTLAAAAHFVGLLESTTVSGEDDAGLFAFATRVLRWFNEPELGPEELLVGLHRAQLILLQHLGFLASVEVCARTGVALEEMNEAQLVPGEGLVDGRALEAADERIAGRLLSAEALRILLAMIRREQPPEPHPQALHALTMALHRCWAIALEREPKTWRSFYSACEAVFGWR